MTNAQTASAATGCDARPFLKPGWSPFNIFLMVMGFILFAPLGLAMLAYIIWGHNLDGFKRDVKKHFSNMNKWSMEGPQMGAKPSGNMAFDEYRRSELERLEKERARIEAMREEFDEYMENLRRARDQEEFDRFMASRKQSASNEGSGFATT